MSIESNVRRILKELPPGVLLEAAAKGRSLEEVRGAIRAGVGIIGENYVQEAEPLVSAIGHTVKWHFIGHLQKNKVPQAVRIFDLVESVDSQELARTVDHHCARYEREMAVLVEINSGREKQKSGVMPEKAEELIRILATLRYIKVKGLMTLGPHFEDPELLRPYFAATRALWEELRSLSLERVELEYLSMGMTDSYRVAIEEGANLVRIGTGIFGPRDK